MISSELRETNARFNGIERNSIIKNIVFIIVKNDVGTTS
jgi:hypothetical protein